MCVFAARFAKVALVGLLAFVPSQNVSAEIVRKRFPSDIADVDLIMTCDSGPITADYAAETASGVPMTDPYAIERGADQGLVSLMTHGGKRTAHYVIPHRSIRAVVRLTYDMDVLDRTDLVFTRGAVTLIHTSTTNAGIFTVSDVYELRYGPGGHVDRTALKGDRDLLHLLDIGLAAYRPVEARCGGPK